ncbi:MAG: hypothetical protein ILA19_02120 [Bacilli bacterium]|nr:hypothetical protein [Bacilli bacterium]
MVDPKDNNEKNKELVEALKTEYDDEEVVVESKSNNVFGFKMKKLLLLFLLIIILLIITLWLLSLSSKEKSINYSSYEKKMISAAKDYYKVNDKELPGNNSSSEVTLAKLVELKYMEDYSLLKSCTGSVTVENKNSSYSYSSYLDCGDDQSSKSLYRHLTQSNNITASGDGLYRMNNEYVFRGEIVNNYVNFSNRLWRIVKIDSNNDIVLILNDNFNAVNTWDDRYNETNDYNSGYNDYEKSRIKDFLDETYRNIKEGNTKDSELLMTKAATKKLVNYKLCIGKVGFNQTTKNNSYECSKVIENTKFGLLTISDYMNASLDTNCNAPSSKSCENYNYLINRNNWWLVTANSDNNYQVYLIESYGGIVSSNAYLYQYVRPVIHLSKNIKYTSGNGTENKPYIIE